MSRVNDQIELSAEQYLHVAEWLEKHVERIDRVVAMAGNVGPLRWTGALKEMEKQSERMDSFAESFRMSASTKFSGYVCELVDRAQSEKTETAEGWRDFVATLHD